MSKNIIIIILLLVSNFCFAQKPKPGNNSNKEANTQTDYSGVYEGILDYAMCCDSYDTATAWIAIDLDAKPPVILYDGVFYGDVIKISNNQLIDISDYSEYPDKLRGYFGEYKGVQGIWYNNIGMDYDKIPKKVFLKKAGDGNTAKELITKYRDEQERWSTFWAGIKADIENMNWSSIASSVYYPIEDNTSYAMDNNTPRILNTAKEFVKRLEKAHKTGTLKSFGENRMEAYRTEDHYPGMPSMYMLDLMTGTFLFTEINGTFKIVQMFGPAG